MDILPEAYQAEIQKVYDCLGAPAWLVGGWLLAKALNRPYIGDIDILADLPPNLLKLRLRRSYPNAILTPRNGIRLLLVEGNHLDVHSTQSLHASGSIEDALNAFPYSANGCAWSLGTPSSRIQTDACETSLTRRAFDFSPGYTVVPGRDDLSLARDAGKLTFAYGLTPSARVSTEQDRIRRTYRIPLPSVSPEALTAAIWPEISHLVPHNTRAWLCRGAVRAAVVGDFNEWDDLDVLIDCSQQRLEQHLRTLPVPYTPSYHGTPKLRLRHGRHVDLIPVSAGNSAASMLGGFYPNTEGAAVELGSGEIWDPYRRLDQIRHSRVDIDDGYASLPPASQRYLALKSTYLAHRHAFTLGSNLRFLADLELDYSFFDLRNATRLAQELLARHGVSPKGRGGSLANGMQSASSIFEAFGLGAP